MERAEQVLQVGRRSLCRQRVTVTCVLGGMHTAWTGWGQLTGTLAVNDKVVFRVVGSSCLCTVLLGLGLYQPGP